MQWIYKLIIIMLLIVSPVHGQECSANTDNLGSLKHTGEIVLEHGKNALNTVILGLKAVNKAIINEYKARIAPKLDIALVEGKVWLMGSIENVKDLIRKKILENNSIRSIFNFLKEEG